jgi:Rrf2 family protein
MPLISQTAEYALRAVVHLAKQAEGDGKTSLTVPEIAAATHVPSGYLSKVLQQLTRAGLITSQRGIGGGFRLARETAAISILDVVQAVDSLGRIHSCPLGITSHTHLCPLHRKLDAAIAQAETAFRETTLAELVSGTNALCKIKLN